MASLAPLRTLWALVVVLTSLLVFWAIFLLALPIGVAMVEVELGLQRFPPLPRTATALLGISTLLALWAAVTLAVRGDGRTFPGSRTRRLVVQGPYAFVRNPLMIAFLGQGAGLGAAFGSVPVLVYVLMCGLLWSWVLRPAQEQRLADQFGAEWRRYAQAVRAWRPRLRRYRPT